MIPYARVTLTHMWRYSPAFLLLVLNVITCYTCTLYMFWILLLRPSFSLFASSLNSFELTARSSSTVAGRAWPVTCAVRVNLAESSKLIWSLSQLTADFKLAGGCVFIDTVPLLNIIVWYARRAPFKPGYLWDPTEVMMNSPRYRYVLLLFNCAVHSVHLLAVGWWKSIGWRSVCAFKGKKLLLYTCTDTSILSLTSDQWLSWHPKSC